MTTTSETMTLIALPPNALGALPWPDGITRFNDKNGEEHFAIAGEWNDTILLLDSAGDVITNLPIALGDIPETLPQLMPLVASVPLQLLAYHVADLRGTYIDQPRNLAKSVTVE